MKGLTFTIANFWLVKIHMLLVTFYTISALYITHLFIGWLCLLFSPVFFIIVSYYYVYLQIKLLCYLLETKFQDLKTKFIKIKKTIGTVSKTKDSEDSLFQSRDFSNESIVFDDERESDQRCTTWTSIG